MNKEFIKELTQKKVGLVLCGGGFKGAYQIGVWKALRNEFGIKRFHSIAGTSVGALNAILIANDDLENSQRIWTEKKFMQWSLKGMQKYLLGYLLLLGPFPAAFLAYVISFFLAYPSNLSLLFLNLGCSLGIASMIISFAIFGRSMEHKVLFFLGPYFLFIPAVLLFVMSLGTIIGGLTHEPYKLSLVSGLFGPIFGYLCSKVGLDNLEKAHRDAELFSNAEIISELGERLNLNSLKQKVSSLFITLARGRTYLDPFVPSIRLYKNPNSNPYDLGDAMGDTENAPYFEPGLSTEWVPEYHNLCEIENKHEAIHMLRLTSAIPFFFRTSTSPAEEIIADGGLIDNMPLGPILHTDVDHIIVIGLDPTVRDSYKNLIFNGNYMYMKSLIPKLDDEKIISMRRAVAKGKEYHTFFPEWSNFNGSLTVITPRQPLATWNYPILSFFTGTLNFRIKNRKKWLKMGYDETKELKNITWLNDQ